MWALSDDVLSLLAQPHGVSGRLVASVSGGPFSTALRLVNGSIKIQRGQRTLDAVVQADLAAASINVLTTEIGASYVVSGPPVVQAPPDARTIAVGTFVVIDTKEDRPGLVSLSARDRWVRISEARLVQPIATQGSIVTAIETLVKGADSRIAFTDRTGSTATHGYSVWDRDRDKAVADLARSIGAEVVFDPLGAAVLRPVGQISDESVLTIGGGQGGMLSSVQRGLTRERTYNAVVAMGEDSQDTPPVFGAAYDLNPQSPTLWGGPFGKKPRFYRSSLLTSDAQAAAAAESMLGRHLGVQRSVDLTMLPHPGLDAGDVVTVEETPGQWQKHVVDSFALPLQPGAVSLATRVAEEESE